MATKLTIVLERDIVELAKSYANKRGRTLSELIEIYLKTLVQKNDNQEDISPKIKKLRGAIKVPKNFNYEKELENALNNKYYK